MAREPTEDAGTGLVSLRPHADVAERVLLPGDPGRALRLAQALTQGPRMLNHNRGLWGYTGVAADGAPLTIQSTGLGGPSAVTVIADLAALGARRVVRAGTCTAVGGLPLGTVVTVGEVLGRDGASRALGATAALTGEVTVASTDLRWEDVPSVAHVRDLTSGAVAAAATAFGLDVAIVLLVAEDASGARLDDAALHAGELELGERALALLGR
jgi:uridine phosphorylase